jgi:CRP-like cAMP-binding protein
VTYAIELLDVFLSEQLKQRVIPILDDLTESERISRLDDFYPRVKLDSKLVLKFMINRDFTQSNRWTKACILFQIGTQQLADFKLDLIAQLFNPDKLICEISAWALFQIDQEEFEENVSRLGRAQKRELNELIIYGKRMTVFEKILFFQRIPIFEKIPGITLSYLADISSEIRLTKEHSLVLDESANHDFYVIVSGSIKLFQRGELVAAYSEGQFIGEMLESQNFLNTNLIIAQTDVVSLKFNKDQFYELLSDNVELSDKILDYI